MIPLIIKVCGLNQIDNISSVINAQPDWVGFIFYDKSPRNLSSTLYSDIAKIDGVKKVGVFVDESQDRILEIIDSCKLDMVQLHGDESPAFCAQINKICPVMKAISVNEDIDLDQVVQFEDKVSYLLFDTKKKGYKGGTGEKFDWSLLKNYKGNTQFLLSGGLNFNDQDAIKEFNHPLFVGIDVNSGFELEPGVKDATLLAKFVKQMSES